MSTEETTTPRRLRAVDVIDYYHAERMASATRTATPETRIELDYKKLAGADPLTTWSLEIAPCFDDGEWRRMLDTAKAAHAELLAEFGSASG
jgi:hypothetical protein